MGHENWRGDDPFERGVRRFAWGIMVMTAVVAVALVSLGGWAVVQLVQWVTSK